MKKIINVLIIVFALAFAFPTTVKADDGQLIKCMCRGGEKCTHRLPSRTFKTFDEWEDYYFAHREMGIYWDSYLYSSCARKYDENGNLIWCPASCYPFEDFETWKNWWATCIEKERNGEYWYEFVNEKTAGIWAVRNRAHYAKIMQSSETVEIENIEGLKEDLIWKSPTYAKIKSYLDYFVK